jgi:succinate dehydrogenase/fumarate reductase flavoprotein subunit/NAD-dependent dihydropyrimidine dehydrogenase PreA subunit
MKNEAYMVPNPVTPNRAILIDSSLCNGCNSCVDVCRTGVLLPHKEKGKPPIVMYPDECWFCGCCVEHCPKKANRMEHPLNQRMGWKRKSTGEYFRTGIKDSHIFDSASEKREAENGQHREWPYPVNYGREHEVTADVLVIGGGLAGCNAAINAAKRGAKVVIVDKGPVIRSGSAGSGIDHWLKACTNPCSKVSPEEMTEIQAQGDVPGEEGEYIMAHSYYIEARESYDALLDVEEMGLEFRDVDNEFAGAEFRDEQTKIMFAYDYENKYDIRLRGGANLKPILYKEIKRLGIQIHDYVMTTSLLTEEGRQGGRVVGATGVDARTGEFYIFRAKATVLSCGQTQGLWIFSTELAGSAARFMDPNNVGDGHAMGWNAGALFTMMERSELLTSTGGFTYPPYATGNAHNTYFACSIVDDNGKSVPWVDRDGMILKTVSERYRPAPGQKFFMHGRPSYRSRGPSFTPDLPERIRNGEFVLPLYADLPGMPEYERKAIFGLMVGNEGKTRIPIYQNYLAAGFDPNKDMLQVNVMPPDGYTSLPWWQSMGPRQWRDTSFSCGVLVTGWDLGSSLEGLYAAGYIGGRGGCSGASATGRYAGRNSAVYARTAADPIIDRAQVEKEKARVYASVSRKDGIGWKEVKAGLCRIMQDYCGECRSEETLNRGLWWLNSIKENEASMLYARNPHELVRVLECLTHITVGEMVIHASLGRKASSLLLAFNRIDYPERPKEWNRFLTIKLENGTVKTGELPLNYCLLPPNAPTYGENYSLHCNL